MALRKPVGAVLGPHGAAPPTAGGGGDSEDPGSPLAIYTDTGQGYDFAIAGMAFKVAVSKERPYERATAEFRKEQFDASQVVGEQSLTGWWLRSQLSLHEGAGIKYYDTLGVEEDVLLNRFRKASSVNPWEPGEVSLINEMASLTTAAIKDAVPATHAGSAGFLALFESGQLSFGTTSSLGSTFATSNGGAPTSITTDGSLAYVVNGNKIEKQSTSTTTSVLWTLDSGTFTGVWAAKGRLFAVDSNGKWYALAKAVGGTVLSASDFFWNSGITGSSWVVTDSPSAAYIANGSDIYSVTIDAQGDVPTLVTPTVVAQVPTFETVSSVQFYVGHLVITTNAGVRIAAADTEGVLYGPLFIEGDFSKCRRIGTKGTEVYVVGHGEGDELESVYSVNLGVQNDDLVPGWTKWFVHNASASSHMGALATGAGLVTFGLGLKVEKGDKAATGYLYTGFHRYGTLEPKQYHVAKVRVAGTGGTVTVSRVLEDESEKTLYTIDVSDSNGEDIGLQLPLPREVLGLKFTLERDDVDLTVGPALLGYQLRALPAPARQRLIRVPLLCTDQEGLRPTNRKGRRGAAWEKLLALEEAEERGAVLRYQDFRTGETGTGYIERLEFENQTAPSNTSTGFGGVIWLTLRRLS